MYGMRKLEHDRYWILGEDYDIREWKIVDDMSAVIPTIDISAFIPVFPTGFFGDIRRVPTRGTFPR